MNIFDLNEYPIFTIAEMSANHGGSLDRAIQTIDAIADAGANAVKVQTFRPESLTMDVDNEFFGPRKSGLWKGRTPWDLYTEAQLPREWHPVLQKHASDRGLVFFSSPFDIEAVDYLESLAVPLYKIASLEITHIPLIRRVLATGKPVIASLGAASEEDIERLIDEAKSAGNEQLVLLKCTAEYPARLNDANLVTIRDMKERFGYRVGLSDHTLGRVAPIAAVAMGATVVEKHFTLDRALGGPDAAFSLEPAEFAEMIDDVTKTVLSLGVVDYALSESAAARRRSLFWREGLSEGDVVQDRHLCIVRPGAGLAPRLLPRLVGCRVARNTEVGQPVCAKDFN